MSTIRLPFGSILPAPSVRLPRGLSAAVNALPGGERREAEIRLESTLDHASLSDFERPTAA